MPKSQEYTCVERRGRREFNPSIHSLLLGKDVCVCGMKANAWFLYEMKCRCKILDSCWKHAIFRAWSIQLRLLLLRKKQEHRKHLWTSQCGMLHILGKCLRWWQWWSWIHGWWRFAFHSSQIGATWRGNRKPMLVTIYNDCSPWEEREKGKLTILAWQQRMSCHCCSYRKIQPHCLESRM